MQSDLYDRLATAASLESDDGAIRILARYEPGAGPGAKVSPPTYARPRDQRDASKQRDVSKEPLYLLEERLGPDGKPESVVLLDSRQSQANRCEEELERAIAAGQIRIPHLILTVNTNGRGIVITSLRAPHRSRDAYFRDSELEGKPFDHTEPGRALADASGEDASALYRYSPADLVYGVWDSHRGRRLQTKFPRVYTSELVGRGALVGSRAAGRYDMWTSGDREVRGGNDDWQPDEKGKGKVTKLSKVGLGAIPPTLVSPGGVTVRTIEREATLSFAGISRVNVGGDAEQQRAARAVLAALALLGDRLAFGGAAIFLRSGCDLVLVRESLSWVRRGGEEEPLQLGVPEALALFGEAVERAEEAGLDWLAEPLELVPQGKLQRVIDEAFLAAPDEE